MTRRTRQFDAFLKMKECMDHDQRYSVQGLLSMAHGILPGYGYTTLQSHLADAVKAGTLLRPKRDQYMLPPPQAQPAPVPLLTGAALLAPFLPDPEDELVGPLRGDATSELLEAASALRRDPQFGDSPGFRGMAVALEALGSQESAMAILLSEVASLRLDVHQLKAAGQGRILPRAEGAVS